MCIRDSGKAGDLKGELKFFGLHPPPPVDEYSWEANKAILTEVASLSREIRAPVIVAGDLNTTPWSSSYSVLEAFTGLKNAVNGLGVVPTWPSQLLGKPWSRVIALPLDHLLLDKSLIVKEHKTLSHVGSCLLYTSPSPRDATLSRMPSSA